jgi:hypothetical protein
MRILPRSSRRRATLLLSFVALIGPSAASGQVSLLFEPHGGTIRWSGEFDRRLEGLIGGRVALQPSRHFGIGFHYARGFDPDERNLTPLQFYGGEITAGVRPLGAVTTSLLLGMAETSNIEAAEGEEPLDPAPALRGVTLGAGLHVPLVRRLSLELAVRDLLTTAAGEWPWAAAAFGDIRHNLVFTGGLGVRVGRRAPAPFEVVAPPAPRAARSPVDQVLVPAQGAIRDAVSDTFVRIPVPREGEIYVRYGPGESRLAPSATGSPGAETGLIRQLIREEMGLPGTASAAGSPLTEAQLRELELRVIRTLDEVLTRRIREEMELVRRQLSADIREIPRNQPLLLQPGPPLQLALPRERTRLTLFGGGSLPAPLQLLAGARADVGAVSRRVPWLRVAPELSLGAGDGGATIMGTGNLIAQLPFVGIGAAVVQPHGGLGLGILGSVGDVSGAARAEGVLNFGLGASIQPSPYSRLRLRPGARIFIEHQGVDLYRTHRLLLGVRTAR